MSFKAFKKIKPACPFTPSQGRTKLERLQNGAEMKLRHGESTQQEFVNRFFFSKGVIGNAIGNTKAVKPTTHIYI